MNIPPLLERLLLSNEATFKNATLGLSGENFIFVPPGKSAVILEINIEPFCNQVNEYFINLLRVGRLDIDNGADIAYQEVLKKLMFQLQVINDTYNTYFSFQNAFSLDWQVAASNSLKDHTKIKLDFQGWKDDVFIYTDRSLYFNIIFPYLQPDVGDITTGIAVTYGNPAADFTGRVQTLPNYPITFRNNTAIHFTIVAALNGFINNLYSPTQRNIIGGETAALREFFTLDTNNGIFPDSPETSIMQPVPSGDPLYHYMLPTEPFINIKYALLNKRPADYGITSPGK